MPHDIIGAALEFFTDLHWYAMEDVFENRWTRRMNDDSG